jgi:hypothetical protein
MRIRRLRSAEPAHLVVAEQKIEDVEIPRDVALFQRTRDRGDAGLLDQPPQADLRMRLAVRLRDSFVSLCCRISPRCT